ncbi:LppX_LprAFG lipoprotein [Tengunoibacter tsumagoiensis]|uniref:Putative diacylated glycolipid transporter LprF n=1 Tax=Tengunoibacter tsumagoiensis TaxID=2014871 RepID=A0A401ZUA2_9CHLR|nr:LppX_LprAFG lipoprotein [Tengunoibacter tsumagoiensis]GCE10417.1 putative diacylated glycolipid transporter LprF [Tengunoibacter tsumagoiensis]
MHKHSVYSHYSHFTHNRMALTFMSCALLLFVLAACGDTSTGSKTPSAQELITKSQAAIQKVTSYHFNLKTDNIGSGSGPTSINIQSANGDVLVPDKLKADASALIAGFSIQTTIIAIGDKQYYKDPLSGGWTPTSNLLDPRALSDSQTGVAAIIGQIQNPSTPTASNVDGTDCWSIDGKLPTQNLAGITGGGTPAGSTVATTVCIGKADNLPYLIKITGVAVSGDKTNTTRTFKLSNFNKPVTINAPV